MSKIPTAEEYLEKICSYYDKTFEPDGDKLYVQANVCLMMKEFAKLHVKSALKLAAESAKVNYSGISNGMYDDEVDRDSILNAYPEENIK